ncbi:MAG: hypothetical protein V4591_09725, partial [Bdellovibrionota bacterium]
MQPLAAKVNPLIYPYLQHELLYRGIFVPVTTLHEKKIILTPNLKTGCLEFFIHNEKLGESGYWNENWNSFYPDISEPFFGTHMRLDNSKIKVLFLDSPEIKTCKLKFKNEDF